MENKVIVYGASGHGKVVVDLILKINLPLEAIVDDSPKSKFLLNTEVRNVSDLEFSQSDNVILAIGNNKIRKKISSKINVQYPSLMHPASIVSNFVTIGQGTVVMAGAVINPDTKIGSHCIINTSAVIEHDCVIEDFVHVSPNVALAGNVSIGEGTQVGIGAVVIQGLKIGKWAIIGAGAVIIRDVPDYAVVVGNPGRIIKYVQNEQY